MKLEQLRDLVEHGRTAKHRRWRTILHWLVRKERGFYAKQGEGYVNEHGFVVAQPETYFYPSWEMLVNSFSVYYANSHEWMVTDDELEDYLPLERKRAPGPEEQTPLNFLP